MHDTKMLVIHYPLCIIRQDQNLAVAEAVLQKEWRETHTYIVTKLLCSSHYSSSVLKTKSPSEVGIVDGRP